MKKEITNFKRKEIFDYYNERSNPFIILTTRVDVTNIFNYCKKNKNYYATVAYFISLVVNEMDCFKYYSENNKIYKHDYLNVGFTDMFEDGEIGFFTCKYNLNYHDFIEDYKKTKKIFIENNKSIKYKDEGEFWVSCAPWFNFSGFIPPFDKSITIPQFIWSKFDLQEGKCYIDLMIMIHHGFADGSHIKTFLEKLNDNINNFDNVICKGE